MLSAAERPEDIADRIVARLAALREGLQGVSSVVKRELFAALVERVQVDLETKDAEVALRLPLWASGAASPMRLAHSSASSTYCETHRLPAVRLGFADCRYQHDRGKRSVCYRCRRRPLAVVKNQVGRQGQIPDVAVSSASGNDGHLDAARGERVTSPFGRASMPPKPMKSS